VSGFFLGATIALAVLLLLPFYRIVRGPTIFDRLLATAMMGTKTMMLLLLMGFALGRADMFVDLALGYGLALLVGTVVTTKYLEAVAGEARAAEQREGREGGG
jgi:multicomponent Na+:H+ antiporter subunit F